MIYQDFLHPALYEQNRVEHIVVTYEFFICNICQHVILALFRVYNDLVSIFPLLTHLKNLSKEDLFMFTSVLSPGRLAQLLCQDPETGNELLDYRSEQVRSLMAMTTVIDSLSEGLDTSFLMALTSLAERDYLQSITIVKNSSPWQIFEVDHILRKFGQHSKKIFLENTTSVHDIVLAKEEITTIGLHNPIELYDIVKDLSTERLYSLYILFCMTYDIDDLPPELMMLNSIQELKESFDLLGKKPWLSPFIPEPTINPNTIN